MTTSDFITTCQHLDVSPFRVVTCEAKTGRCLGTFAKVEPLAIRLRDTFDMKIKPGPVICRGCVEVGSQFMGTGFVAEMVKSRTDKCTGYLRSSIISG